MIDRYRTRDTIAGPGPGRSSSGSSIIGGMANGANGTICTKCGTRPREEKHRCCRVCYNEWRRKMHCAYAALMFSPCRRETSSG
jgi:hypothetical protein